MRVEAFHEIVDDFLSTSKFVFRIYHPTNERHTSEISVEFCFWRNGLPTFNQTVKYSFNSSWISAEDLEFNSAVANSINAEGYISARNFLDNLYSRTPVYIEFIKCDNVLQDSRNVNQ